MQYKEIIDQMGRSVKIPSSSQRVISLVPSQTELIYFLAPEKLIARTHFCVHPEAIITLDSVGGTKKLQLDKIRSLQPDLIIGNKEENEQAQIEELEKEFPVWMSDIHNEQEAFEMMLKLGDVVGASEKASTLVQNLKLSFARIKHKAARFNAYSVLYFIWRKPWMLAGKNTFIHQMLLLAGFNPICEEERYPELKSDQEAPSLILLSSEPYPFSQSHFEEIHELFPEASIQLVDGEVFSWYGNRLLHLETYLDQLEKELT